MIGDVRAHDGRNDFGGALFGTDSGLDGVVLVVGFDFCVSAGFDFWFLRDVGGAGKGFGFVFGDSKDGVGGDAIGGFDGGEDVVAGLDEFAHSFAGLLIVVASSELELEERFEAFGGGVCETAVFITLKCDVACEGDDVCLRVGSSRVVGFAHRS